EHRPDVGDPLLERRHVRNRIREAGPGLVVHDQARERSEPFEELVVARVRPLQIEMRDKAGNDEQVRPATPDDLVGDADLASPGVPRLRRLHEQSLEATSSKKSTTDRRKHDQITSIKSAAFPIRMTQRTLSDRAFNVLREGIISGRLAPGSKLDYSALAAELEMSPMPIREAIRQLHALGLVEHSPHRSARVTELSVDDLR